MPPGGRHSSRGIHPHHLGDSRNNPPALDPRLDRGVVVGELREPFEMVVGLPSERA